MTSSEPIDNAISALDEFCESLYEDWRKDHADAPAWAALDPDPARRIDAAADLMEAAGD